MSHHPTSPKGRLRPALPALAGLLLLSLCALHPGFARAQYYAGLEPGYALTPVASGAGLALDPASPDFAVLRDAAGAQGLILHGAFRVESGMSRFFGINTFGLSEEGQARPLEEDELSLLRPLRLPPQGEQPSYSFDGRQVCIGLGQDQPQEEGEYNWSPLRVLSFALGEGRAELLDQWELPAQYSEGIYALDLVRDGVVELVVPWATGVAGGGGADVMAVVPTGGLAGFGGPDEQADPDSDQSSSFYSSNGNINLLDFNGDGDWELETSFPLFAAIYAYYYPALYSFDRQAWAFVDARAGMPEYYAPVDDFYRGLLAALEQALARPADFYLDPDPFTEGPGYGFRQGDETLTLSPFMSPGDDPQHPVLDDYNIEVLRSLVAELNGAAVQ